MTNVSKRTIDYYTNIGLLEAQRSTSNYRYYTKEAIQKLTTIKELKSQKLSLDEIKKIFHEQNACEVSLGELKEKLQGLEKDVTEIIELIQRQKISKDDIAKKHISHESISLIQSLLILLL